MSDNPRNLFNSLFEFHPREGHTPKENFLSEGFAYILETYDEARNAWLSLALGRQIKSSKTEMTTRSAELNEDNAWNFPDMVMEVVLDDGKIYLYSEHKWNSPCNVSQIEKYLKLIQRKHGEKGLLVFLGASRRQKMEAENCNPTMKGKAFMWADIYKKLDALPSKSDILVQYLKFMETHGLNPGNPIKPATMVAYIQSAGFLASLEHSANKLNNEFEWDFFPKRYLTEREVNKKWGRVAIEFTTPAWKPTITVGFLYDEEDHGVSFINKDKGIDLLLRIEANPPDLKNIALAFGELQLKQAELSKFAQSVLLLNDRGSDNEHTILIARSCLGDVIGKETTQEEQAELIYMTIKKWGEILFGDGKLEGAFKKSGLDSGM